MPTPHNELVLLDLAELTLSPPIGPLSLLVQLRQHGIDADYFDLSREILTHLGQPDTLLRLVEQLTVLEVGPPPVSRREQWVCRTLRRFIERQLRQPNTVPADAARSQATEDALWYLYSLLVENRYQLQDRLLLTHPALRSVRDGYLLPKFFLKSGAARRLRRHLLSTGGFQQLLRRCVARADVICLSANYLHLYDLALELAEALKLLFPTRIVVVGGSVVRFRFRSNTMRLEDFRHVDYFATDEGEPSLPRLVEALQGRRAVEDVPNLAHVAHGAIRNTDAAFTVDLNALPLPDYGLYLRKYGFPRYRCAHIEEPFLLYEVGRGCSWRKCAFCLFTYLSEGTPCREKTPDKVAQDLVLISEETGIDYFWLVIEHMTPVYARRFSRQLLAAGRTLRWRTYARFDAGFDRDTLELMYQSGCRYLGFGLESGSQEINDRIRKGVDVRTAARILQDCAETGIIVRLFTIVGFPMESLAQAAETFAFIHRNRKAIKALAIFLYWLAPRSYMHLHPDEFDIRRIVSLRDGTYEAPWSRPKRHVLNAMRHAYRAYLARTDPDIAVLVY